MTSRARCVASAVAMMTGNALIAWATGELVAPPAPALPPDPYLEAAMAEVEELLA